MPKELRRKDDVIMSELSADVKMLQEAQSSTHKSIDELNKTVADFIWSTSVDIKDIKHVLKGSKEYGIEGIADKVARHEKGYSIVMAAVSNWKFLALILGVLGVGSISDFVNLIQKVTDVANNTGVQNAISGLIVRAFE